MFLKIIFLWLSYNKTKNQLDWNEQTQKIILNQTKHKPNQTKTKPNRIETKSN